MSSSTRFPPPLRAAASVAALSAALLVLRPGPAAAQSMSDLLDDLFVFGGGDQLFLTGSADVPSTKAHGDHFLPDRSESNGAVLSFFTRTVARNVSSFPLPSTVSSETFVFVDGVPTPTSNSFGPISSERAQTIGRGRLNAGAIYSRLRFSALRGVPLDRIGMTFIHVNADFPGCDEAFEGDCTEFGIPQVENDLIHLSLDLDVEAEVYAFYTTYGLTDWLDLSVAVPIVDLEMRGASVARITPSTPDQALHFFGGTPENPQLEARSQVNGATTGIGDIAVRLKGRITRNDVWDVAALGELRAPTGRREDFLGAGDPNVKGILILSGTFQEFSPHLNLGYEHRGSALDEDEVELAVGFDHLLGDQVTLAVDLLGSFKLADDPLEFPKPVELTAPFRRTVERTNIPDRRDDIVDASFGFKLRTSAGLVIVVNTLVPLNDGGLRSSPVPTVGVEYSPR